MHFSVDAHYLVDNLLSLSAHVGTPDQLQIEVLDGDHVFIHLRQGGRKATLELEPPHVKTVIQGVFSYSGRECVAGLLRLFLQIGKEQAESGLSITVSCAGGKLEIGGMSLLLAENTGGSQERTPDELAELIATGQPFVVSSRDRNMLKKGIKSYAEVAARQPEYLEEYAGKILPGNTRLSGMVLAYHDWTCGSCGLMVREGGRLKMENLHVVVLPSPQVASSLSSSLSAACSSGVGCECGSPSGSGDEQDGHDCSAVGTSGSLDSGGWLNDQLRVMCSKCYRAASKSWKDAGLLLVHGKRGKSTGQKVQ